MANSSYNNLTINGKTILVMGAGVYQIPAITTAKGMGLRVVTVDGNSNAPGLPMSDVSRVVDLRDEEGCLAVAQEFKVDGIVSICTDVAVPTVAALGTKLGLPSISPDAALGATDKFVMRQMLADAGVPGPEFRLARNRDEGYQATKELGFPLIVKPVDNAGSRGVTKVDNPAAFPVAFAHAMKNSRKSHVILEEFMVGVESTIDSITSAGHTEVLAISDKDHLPTSPCVSISINFSPSFSLEVQEEIKILVKRAVKALGIEQGATHTEVMVTPNGIKIVELGARGGGCHVFSVIVPAVSGVDTVKETIKLALGVEPDIRPKTRRAAVLRWFNPQVRGKLIKVLGLEEAKAVEGILDVEIEASPGQTIGSIAWDGDRPGYLISHGDTRAEAFSRADEAEGLVIFQVESQAVASG